MMMATMHQMHERAGEEKKVRYEQDDMRQMIDQQISAQGCSDETRE